MNNDVLLELNDTVYNQLKEINSLRATIAKLQSMNTSYEVRGWKNNDTVVRFNIVSIQHLPSRTIIHVDI